MQADRRRFLGGTVLGGTSLFLASQGLGWPSGSITWQASRSNFPEIVYSRKSAPPVLYAAEQLDHYLRKILGSEAPTSAGRGPRILLEEVSRADLGEEGFELLCQGGDLFVRGTPSGIVYGVFDFLRRYAGCHFSGYGPDGEEVPRRESLQLAAFQSVRKPRLWYRGYQFSMREPLEMIIKDLNWMAKNGMNYVMYMPLPDDVTDPIGGSIDPHLGDAAERTLQRYTEAWFREYVQPEVLRRGLKLDFNHHNLGYWLPPERYYDQHPEWYALIDGQRTQVTDHRQLCICTSNEEAVDTLLRNVLAFLRANPAVGIVGVIQEDGIGMCQCDRCVRGDPDPKDAFRPYKGNSTPAGENSSKSLRLARLVNAVARAVGKEFPGRWVGHAAYNDVRWPPRGVTMEPNVVTWFQAADTDIAHALSADSPSAVNRFLFDILRQWKQAHPGKVILYDVFMGVDQMKSFPYPKAEAVCQAWPQLKRLGIDGATIQAWSSNHETYAMQSVAFARSGWEDTVNAGEVLEEYVTGAFGAAAPQVRPVFAGLQEAVRLIAQGKAPTSLFLSRLAPGYLGPDAATVGYFLEEIGEEALRRAATPIHGGREEAQVRNLAAILEYWRRGTAIMRLELLADRAAKEGRKAEATALYEKAIAASKEIVLYISAQPPRGWISISTLGAWHETAMRWRAATAQREFTTMD